MKMRRSIPFLALLLATTACGEVSPGGDRTGSYAPSEEMAADAVAPAAPGVATREVGPNVSPTAAPGVAFNYHYAFRLAAPRIAEVQEQHAQLCERLTVARCRITGMHYRVVNDRDIEAMLAFKLDPAVARHFGREGVQAVVRAEGMLTESRITGTDVGTGIDAANRSLADLQADLARIEERLRAGVPAAERARLDEEARILRDRIRDLRDNRDAQRQSLANTPMVFNYGSGDLSPGFDQRHSFRRAWETALENVSGVGLGLFVILVTLLPWIALGLLAWWAVLAVRRRWFPKAATAGTEKGTA